jgi:hypothetical protein
MASNETRPRSVFGDGMCDMLGAGPLLDTAVELCTNGTDEVIGTPLDIAAGALDTATFVLVGATADEAEVELT